MAHAYALGECGGARLQVLACLVAAVARPILAAGDEGKIRIHDADDPARGQLLLRQQSLEGRSRHDEREVSLVRAARHHRQYDRNHHLARVRITLQRRDDQRIAGRRRLCPGWHVPRRRPARRHACIHQNVAGAVEQDHVSTHHRRRPRQPVERRQVAAGQLVGGGQGAQQNLRLDEFAVRQLVQRARRLAQGGLGGRHVGLVGAPDQQGRDRQTGDQQQQCQAEQPRADRAAKQRPGASLHHRCGRRAALVRREHAPDGRQGGRQPRSLASAASARFRPHQ